MPLLFFICIIATGLLMWGRAREAILPPGPEPLSYQQKAKHVWDDVRSGLPKNPFNLAPAHRSPGTVLVSYPLGYDPDPRGFFFRSLFLPLLVWTAAILLILWPEGATGSPGDRWKPFAGALLFGPLPAFFQFESPAMREGWGHMDLFLGSLAALAVAGMDRGVRLRNRGWVAASICLASSSLLVKPAGGWVILGTTMYLLLAEAGRYGQDGREGRGYNPYPLVTGLVTLWVVGGGIAIICLQTAYLDHLHPAHAEEGLSALDSPGGDGWGLSRWEGLWTLTGPAWLVLAAGQRLIRRSHAPHPPDGLRFRTWFSVFTLSAGMAYAGMRADQMNIATVSIPFVFMASVPLIGTLFPRFHDGLAGRIGTGVLPICLAVAVNTLLLLFIRNPPVVWQRLSGVSLNVAETDRAAVGLGRRLADSLRKSGTMASVHVLGGSREERLFSAYGEYRAFQDSGAGDYTHTSFVNGGEPTHRLSEMIFLNKYILFHRVPGPPAGDPRDSGRAVGPQAEANILGAFLSRLDVRQGMETVDSSGELRLVRVVSPQRFSAAFDSLFRGHAWSTAFRTANLGRDGRLRLTDPFAEPEHIGDVMTVTEGDAGNLERVSNDPSFKGTSQAAKRWAVVGWVVRDREDGTADGQVFVTIETPGERTRYVPTERLVRDDLVAALGRPGVRMAGYHARINAAGLSGRYTLGVAILEEGRLYRLPRYDREWVAGAR
jgi:hypothetical protein